MFDFKSRREIVAATPELPILRIRGRDGSVLNLFTLKTGALEISTSSPGVTLSDRELEKVMKFLKEVYE